MHPSHKPHAMNTPIDLKELNRSLALTACKLVIHEAALMLKAHCLSNADGYMFMGSDKVLCRPDESIANADEIYAYRRHCCCSDLVVSYDDLTLLDCVRWICGCAMVEGEDSVTFDDVLTVAGFSHAVKNNG
jgi:hypothetical protein